MKAIIKTTVLLSVLLSFYACKKDSSVVALNAGVLNVTNAVIGGSTITLLTDSGSTHLISTNNTISGNNYAFLPVATGAKGAVTLEVPPVAATATTATIPAVVYYSNQLSISSADNYSLFLTGLSPAAVDYVLIKESYPRTYSDSSCGVRFINLSPGSNPISVNIKNNANGSEVGSLAYKAYSDFIKHPAVKATASYIFEFRDAGTGTLLTSYTLTTPYFHNVTLALRGKSGAYGVILDNDY